MCYEWLFVNIRKYSWKAVTGHSSAGLVVLTCITSASWLHRECRYFRFALDDMLVNTTACCIKASETRRGGAVACDLLWGFEAWSWLPYFPLGLWNRRVSCRACSWQLQGPVAEANSCIPPTVLDYSTLSANEMKEYSFKEALTQQIQTGIYGFHKSDIWVNVGWAGIAFPTGMEQTDFTSLFQNRGDKTLPALCWRQVKILELLKKTKTKHQNNKKNPTN